MARMIFRTIIRIVIALAISALLSCQSSPDTNAPSPAPSSSMATHTETRATSGPIRDLTQDERAGGHIIRKHVGQTEQQLRNRLEREHDITGASTYTDLSTAEHAVGAAIAQSQGEIQNWLGRSGRHT